MKQVLAIALLLAATGCSTVIYGTAPSPQAGSIIAVGSKNNLPQAWSCKVPKAGPCTEITIAGVE